MTQEPEFEALRPLLFSSAFRREQDVGLWVPEPLLADPSETGHPGSMMRDRPGKVFSAWRLDIVDGAVQNIRSVNTPDKLRHLGPDVKLQAVVEERNRARRGTR